VIGLQGQNQGSLIDLASVTVNGANRRTVDWGALGKRKDSTRLVLIQRSCGYSWRPVSQLPISKNCPHRQTAQNTICFVDNCYGEFIENREPTAVGADLIAGSLIKNPGGTIVTAGGYVAGREDLVEAAAA